MEYLNPRLQHNQMVLIYEEGVLSYSDIKSWQDVPVSHINTTWHVATNSEMELFCAVQQIPLPLVKNQRQKLSCVNYRDKTACSTNLLEPGQNKQLTETRSHTSEM